MQIYYCKHCRSRVSSVEIDSGKGILSGKDPYCQKCVKELDLTPAPETPKKTTREKASSITSLSHNLKRRQIRRDSDEKQDQTPAPAKHNSKKGVLGFVLLGIVLVLLAGLGYHVSKISTKENSEKTSKPDIAQPEKVNKEVKKEEEKEVAKVIQKPVVKPKEKTKVKEKPKQTESSTGEFLIPAKAEWSYLAGSNPEGAWKNVEFDDSAWKKGLAGFGYGDKDDVTILKDMRRNYKTVYIRKQFTIKDVESVSSMILKINFDDGFIAYINGKEVTRSTNVKGSGSDKKQVTQHEAKGLETFGIKDFKNIVKSGVNVLAIEGHNHSLGSSDFTLDPNLKMNE